MKDKICLITGANAGIGFETAKGLAKLGAQILMVSRDLARGETARKEIVASTGNKNIHLFTCDFSLQQDIRKLAADVKAHTRRLDVLVNNAGCFFTELHRTSEGIEMQFAVNHLGYFLLTAELLDLLKASSPSRIVNVSSNANYSGKIAFDYLDGGKPENYNGLRAYSQTKLANVLFTYELARRLEGTGITANCLHPGVIKTDIAQKNASGKYYWAWTLAKPFMLSLEKGARTTIYLASSDEVEGVTGKYFFRCREKRSADLSYDDALAKKLWEVSAEMVSEKTSGKL